MAKLILYITACLCLIYTSLTDVQNPRLEILGSGEYCFYSRDQINSSLITKKIDSGIGFIYYCDSSNAGVLRPLFEKIDGESITLKKTSPTKILKLLNYNKVSSTSEVYYGYSNRGKAFIKNGNTKINIQISSRDGITTVGWPVILGSY